MLSLILPLLAAVLNFSNDPELVRRLKNRDPNAMADLYDRYGRAAYALIFRIVRNTGVAEDLVQETFLRVWNRVHGFDEERGALGPWILTIARNRAIDYTRSVEGRRRDSVVDLERMEQPALFANFENRILNLDRVRVLRDAFGKLKANQRLVIQLAYYDGLSQSEIAELLSQPLGTGIPWVRSALKMLREEFGTAVA